MHTLLRNAIWIGLIMIIMMTTTNLSQSQDTVLYTTNSNQSVNARSCPQITCAVLFTIPTGASVEVIETTDGDTVAGSNQWYRVVTEDGEAFVHSSLLVPLEGAVVEDEDEESTTTTFDTSDWLEYTDLGFKIAVPEDFVNYTNNSFYINFLVSELASQQDLDEFGETYYLNQLNRTYIFINPRTNSQIQVYAQYNGRVTYENITRLSAECAFMRGSVCERVDLPIGPAVRNFKQYETDAAAPTDEYYFAIPLERTMIHIYVFSPRDSEDLLPLADAVANSLEIEDVEDIREFFRVDAGEIVSGDNKGTLEPTRFSAWTYEAVEGEGLSICTCPTSTNVSRLDLYLILRAPDGTIIAENDDISSINNSAGIELVIPEDGLYTIEVHAWDGYQNGDYVLSFESNLKTSQSL